MNIEEIKEALGAEVGGYTDEEGWHCADCPAEGLETKGAGAFALARHHREAKHGWKDA
jgi:hypothetical protein